MGDFVFGKSFDMLRNQEWHSVIFNLRHLQLASGFGPAGSVDSGTLAHALGVQPGDFLTDHQKLVCHDGLVSTKNGD